MHFLEIYMIFYSKNFQHQISAYISEQRIPTGGSLSAISCLFFFSTSEVSPNVNEPLLLRFTIIFSNSHKKCGAPLPYKRYPVFVVP